MIERAFDIPFVADLALREKQIQQNYRPIIAVHKWFARRPGTLFRALLLSEFSNAPSREAFYNYVDISFYFGGIGFSSDVSTLRILEWDGKAFRDITTVLDVNRMIITRAKGEG